MSRIALVPAAYVYLQGDSGVLLQERMNTGFNDGRLSAGAAGHVEAGETPWAAAVREAREELGVTIDPADLHFAGVAQRTAAPHRQVDERVDFYFMCRRWSGTPRICEPQKVRRLVWVNQAALHDPRIVAFERDVLIAHASSREPVLLSSGFDTREEHDPR